MASKERLRAHLGTVYGRSSDTLLMALLGALGRGLDRGHTDGEYAVLALDYDRTAGRWLNLWGDHFKVGRRDAAETDNEYASRIIAETVRQRPQIHALEKIVEDAFGIDIALRDLYPYVLLSDQWTTLPGYPLQVGDGHLSVGFNGSLPDAAARADAYPPYAPGIFGVWLTIDGDDPFAFTLEQVQTAYPLILMSDQHVTGSAPYTHVSDGHITSPDLSGGPSDTARKSFGPLSPNLPVSTTDMLALLDRHRAAGTKAEMMKVTII